MVWGRLSRRAKMKGAGGGYDMVDGRFVNGYELPWRWKDGHE